MHGIAGEMTICPKNSGDETVCGVHVRPADDDHRKGLDRNLSQARSSRA